MKYILRSLTLIALALAAAGCRGGGPVDEAPYYDLVAELPTARVDAGEPAAIAERGVLFLPAGSRIAYPLFVAAGSTLRADRIVPRGATLEVSLETEDGDASLARYERSTRRTALPLGPERRVPAWLVLAAGDGGDGDGVLLESAALWAASTAPAPAVEPPAEPANVLVYLIDTLRRDRLGCYGYSKPLTPHLDAFAARATLYENAIGQSSWTKASVASIFTGVWPGVHGAVGWKHKLAPEFETLAERLEAAGYRTAAVSTNPNVTRAYGMHQGFDDFIRVLKLPSEEVHEEVVGWLDAHGGDPPWLFYVHAMDPHPPYTPPEPFRTRFAPDADRMPSWKPRWRWPLEALPYLVDLYDAEVAANDASFGRLIAELEARDLYDDLLLIVTSDHGEEFKEHGRWRHGGNLFGETLNVPLIVKYPGQTEGRRLESIVQHVDLTPTILAAAGAPVPEGLDGRLLPRRDGGATPAGRVYSHVRLGRTPLTRSIVDGEWKLIRKRRKDGFATWLYNWREDPGETRNVARRYPVRASVLAALLEAKSAAAAAPAGAADAAPDEEIVEALEALGYLE